MARLLLNKKKEQVALQEGWRSQQGKKKDSFVSVEKKTIGWWFPISGSFLGEKKTSVPSDIDY